MIQACERRLRGSGGAAGLAVAALALACGGAATPPVVAPPSAALSGPPPPLELSAQEQALADELRRSAAELVAFGPRSAADVWNLAGATDHLALRLERLGLEVRRQGFVEGGEPLQNLEVVLAGEQRAQDALVLVARFDSSAGSAGANESALSAALLLGLAERLPRMPLERDVRLVWLAGESDRGTGVGSQAYARHVRATKQAVRVVVTLGSLGYFTQNAKQQHYPDELIADAPRPRAGEFLALVSNQASREWLKPWHSALNSKELPIEEWVVPETAALVAQGPQARFWQAGLPGLLLTDTAALRDPEYAGAGDTLERLDLSRLAWLLLRLEDSVRALDASSDGGATGSAQQ